MSLTPRVKERRDEVSRLELSLSSAAEAASGRADDGGHRWILGPAGPCVLVRVYHGNFGSRACGASSELRTSAREVLIYPPLSVLTLMKSIMKFIKEEH